MAPSGGGCCYPVRSRRSTVLIVILLISAGFIPSGESALVARTEYAMDQRYDCVSNGIQDVPRGQTTYLRGRSGSGTGGTELNCLLQFAPQTKGDTLRVWFEPGAFMDDCKVELQVELSNAGGYSYGCLSQSVPDELKADNGVARVQLRRENFDNVNYNFRLAIRAQRSIDEAGGAGGSSSADAGMIAGIVAGVIVLLIILAVICVCCRRRRRENLARDRSRNELKQDLTKESLNTSIGYDNKGVQNGRLNTSANDSPSSDKKLLVDRQQMTALDRFGPSPSQRRRQLNSKRDYDDVERGRGEEHNSDYEEQEVRPRENRMYQEREFGRRRDDYSDSDYDPRRDDYEVRGFGRRRNDDVRRPEPESSREGNQETRMPPLLEALHKNPKFRRSFHENEAAAEDRVRRVSGSNEDSRSSGSVDSTGVPKPPKLPPVPKSPPRSPSPQRRGEKIAGIFRARPSSSSSEVARVDGETEVMGDSPRSRDERTPDREDREKKADTRHTLRPNRGDERRPREEKRRDRQMEDESEEERRRERRERDRRDEERARRRRQEEEEEQEEEERRRKKQEKKRKEEERRRQEEEDDEEERRRRKRDREREEDKKEYEGRFKKSASGRRSKGKGTRMGRSRSTGNALEEMESNYQRSRSKSPSSVRSLNFIEDDDEDEDLDSNYMPFRRAGSKTSLYASRSSLYGRRRKNSMGETMSMSSYAHDDMDSRMGDFDRVRMSHRDKEKMFRSTGDLEMRPASAQIVRDCATQTGSERAVYVYGKKTLAKERPGKRYSRGTQTGSGRERRDSVGSAKSGRSTKSNQKLKSRSKSQESLRREKRSRSRGYDDDEESDYGRRRGRSKSRDRDYSDDELDGRRRKHRSKSRDISDDEDDRRSKSSRSKPRPRPRRSQGTASVDLSDSADDFDDDKSGVASSVAPSSVLPGSHQGYPPAMYPPGYPMAYPTPGAPYVPVAPVVVGGAYGQPAPPAQSRRPPVAPKPTKSKWDQLVAMTDGEKQRLRHQGDSVAETESVLSSAYGRPPQVVYAPPSYTSGQRFPDPNSTISSAYPDSSGAYKLYQGSNYAPSDSAV